MSAKAKFNPQVWTLVRDGQAIKTCLVCANRVCLVGKIKTVDGTEQFTEIIHPVAINLAFYNDAKLEISQFQFQNGQWERSTELEKFNLTERTASAALGMAWRFAHPKTKIDMMNRHAHLHSSPAHSEAVATKQNASTVWKLKAFLCHAIWERQNLTIEQRLQSLAMQGHPGVSAKAYTRAIEEAGI